MVTARGAFAVGYLETGGLVLKNGKGLTLYPPGSSER